MEIERDKIKDRLCKIIKEDWEDGGSVRNILVGRDQGVDVTVKEEDGTEKQRIGPSELGEGHHIEIPGQRQRRRRTNQVDSRN